MGFAYSFANAHDEKHCHLPLGFLYSSKILQVINLLFHQYFQVAPAKHKAIQKYF